MTDYKREKIMSNIAIGVYCASSDQVADIYVDTSRKLGEEMVKRGMSLVYGGGNNGLMGVLSLTIHENGGRITGVIPKIFTDMGYAYDDVDEMIVTDGMRERKSIMEERADAFIAMPGGFGTLEELLEVITFKQLKFHIKPIVILNIDGFYDGLLNQFERGYEDNFVGRKYRSLYTVSGSVRDALDTIEQSIVRKISG
ncbi:putative cytokinin riboside 5'-monophosphate phosphoribohydrolase [subsurface metagenome]